ncbi:MAG: prepilin peptidase [Pseudomonadota bacterium]
MDIVLPWEAFSRFEPAFPDIAARVFLIVMVPVWFYMAWYDMARLKILNGLVVFVFGVFVVLGPLLLPWQLYLGQIIQAAAMFIFMLILYSAGAMGGGDAKFIAAASPYFMREDVALILILFTACALGAFVAHRLSRLAGTDRATPLWQSWRSGKRFPLGYALGGVVTGYLALAAF